MKHLKKYQLLGLAAVIALVSAFSSNAFVTTYPLIRTGPAVTTTLPFDSTTGGQAGCIQSRIFNANDSLRVGQVTYFTAKNKVDASATLANYNAIAGVVIGGARTSMATTFAIADTSTLAATANQRVILCITGRLYVLVDTVTGGIAPGKQIIPSLVKGRVKERSTAIDTFYRVFGKMVDTGVRNSVALAQIAIR